jgi:hypothetical protein
MICTAEFRQESIRIEDASGNPVTLDSFVVTTLAGTALPNGAAGSVYGYPYSGQGQYTLINDAWLAGNQNSTMQVIAKGFKGGSAVFSEAYTIAADCCHVGKQAGKDVIIIP